MGHRRVWAGFLGATTAGTLLALSQAELPITITKPELALPPIESGPDIRRDATVIAVEEVMPSVVNIATTEPIPYDDYYSQLVRDFYGLPKERLNLGSGIIIDEDGYILTNLHVVKRATRVQVKLADGRVYDADKIVATSKSDVALLKLRSKPGEKFKAIKLAPDNDLLLGETVMALGNPFGLGGSVARGILSSKNRRPPVGNEPLNFADWLQTDAAINPGNSGGPLINLRGELIGINVAVYKEGQGIGFAIPAREVSTALSQFVSPEIASSKWFGAWLKNGLPAPIVGSVQPASPAEKAGLVAGMQIIQVNGQPTRSLLDFLELMMRENSQELALTVLDQGKQRNFKVRLEPFEDLVKRRMGLVLKELTGAAAARLGLMGGEGLLIEAVEPNSPAEQAELKPGMLITAFDTTAVNELRDVGFALINKEGSTPATLTLSALKRLGGPYVQPVQVKVDVALRKP